MTPFTNGGRSVLKVAALVATAVLWAWAAHANGVRSASAAAQSKGTPTCDPQPVSARPGNRYTLLLFFNDGKHYLRAIQVALGYLPPGQSTPKSSGCILDPDVQPPTGSGITVEGSCPTDCTARDVIDRKGKYTPGDPLSQVDGDFNWGIFFADPAGTLEAADDDSLTTFGVWQIEAKDSCHAGRILQSLKTTSPNVFAPGGGYIGQIMIAHAPPTSAASDRSKTPRFIPSNAAPQFETCPPATKPQ